MVLGLVIPMAVQNLINVAVTSADVLMLGKVGEKVLSGASLAGQVQFIMTLIFFGVASGAAVLTAQYWGKRDTRTIEKVLALTLRFSVSVGLFFMLAVLFFAEPIMRIFTPETEVILQGASYLRIVGYSYVCIAITMSYLNIMRSIEKVLISTFVYGISLIINIALNAIFIFGLFGMAPMGIKGAALGTLIARIVEVLIVVYYARFRNKEVKLHLQDFIKVDKIILKDFITYSSPVIFNELMWGAATSANAVVMGHLGSSVVAANSVAQVTRQLATVIAFGISNAAAITLGKAIGQGDFARAKDYARRFIFLSLVAGSMGALVILAIRPFLIYTLTISEVSKGYLSIMMFVMAYFVIAQAFNTTMIVGIFRAGGDTKFGLYLDVLTMWGGSILMGALAAFVFKWSVPVVYMLLLSDELIKFPFTLWRYRKGKWLKNVTRDTF